MTSPLVNKRTLEQTLISVETCLHNIHTTIQTHYHLHSCHYQFCYRNCLDALPSLQELHQLQFTLTELKFQITMKLQHIHHRVYTYNNLVERVHPILLRVCFLHGMVQMCMMLHMPRVPTVS